MKVYAVDDDPDILEVIETLLQAAGHVVTTNLVGTTALSEISANPPDCVLTDLVMAELDGLELCREIRGRTRLDGTAVIFVSARNTELWAERAREAGGDGYITKPLNSETFAAEVAEIVGSSGRAG